MDILLAKYGNERTNSYFVEAFTIFDREGASEVQLRLTKAKHRKVYILHVLENEPANSYFNEVERCIVIDFVLNYTPSMSYTECKLLHAVWKNACKILQASACSFC